MGRVAVAARKADVRARFRVGGDSAYAHLLVSELPKVAPTSSSMRLASFFCCAGGIDLGFRSAGFQLAFANDISAKACDTYRANLGHAPVHRDIREIGPSDYPGGEIDVVTGGFPCVTFSMAGRRMGVTDDLNGKLYLQLCRVISEIKPRYFVAENVEGILSANGGAAVKLVTAAFLRLGYRTAYELVNMAEHGVPQTRKRVIFVGVRLDQWRGSFRFPVKTRRLYDDKAAPRWLPLARTLSEAIGDLGPPSAKDRNRYDESRSGAMSKRVGKRGRRAPTLVSEAANVQPFIGPPKGHEANETKAYAFNQTRQVASRRRPAPTATTPVQNQPWIEPVDHAPNNRPLCETFNSDARKIVHAGKPSSTIVSESVSPWVRRDIEGRDDVAARNPDFFNPLRPAGAPSPTMTSGGQAEVLERAGAMRRMTVRECARVQSFPDWFEFGGSQADGYTLVGNAVPPLYAKRLAFAIQEYDVREIIK